MADTDTHKQATVMRDVALGFLFVVLPVTALVFAWRIRRQHVDPWPGEDDGNDW